MTDTPTTSAADVEAVVALLREIYEWINTSVPAGTRSALVISGKLYEALGYGPSVIRHHWTSEPYLEGAAALSLQARLDAVEGQEAVASQWRVLEDGAPRLAWQFDNQGDRAGWLKLSEERPETYRLETRLLYASPPSKNELQAQADEVVGWTNATSRIAVLVNDNHDAMLVSGAVRILIADMARAIATGKACADAAEARATTAEALAHEEQQNAHAGELVIAEWKSRATTAEAQVAALREAVIAAWPAVAAKEAGLAPWADKFEDRVNKWSAVLEMMQAALDASAALAGAETQEKVDG